MSITTTNSINCKIVEMRKKRCGLFVIFKWVEKWGDFQHLDEIVVLIHILNILNKANLAVSKNEVRNNFNRFYKKDCHGDKVSYLSWIYGQTQIKTGTIVKGSQIRNKRAIRQTSEGKEPLYSSILEKTTNSNTKLLGGLYND